MKFAMTNYCFKKSFQEYFYTNESLYFKYCNKIGYYFKKKIEVGFLNTFKTEWKIIFMQNKYIEKMSGIDPSCFKEAKQT